MFGEEGLPAVFARHRRHAEATRRAVRAWGLDIVCRNPAACSSTLTAVLIPYGQDADLVREIVLERFNAALGAGLGKLAGRAFRIGHLGDLGDLTLAGALCGVEMGWPWPGCRLSVPGSARHWTTWSPPVRRPPVMPPAGSSPDPVADTPPRG